MCMMPILVVEDNFLVAASLEAALCEAGHAVTLARTIAEADAALAGAGFRAALLDYALPDGDSLDLARRLHAFGCPVAVVSGVDRDQVPLDAAISARFAKPMDEREVMAWVGAVAAGGRAMATGRHPLAPVGPAGAGTARVSARCSSDIHVP